VIHALLQGEQAPSRAVFAKSELQRAGAMRIGKRRDDFLLGRWTAKLLLARVLGGEADPSIEVRAAASGAPEPWADGRRLPLTLSLSHREGLALAAVDDSAAPIGADLEHIEPRSAAFVRDYFTSREQRYSDELFANLIWSAKESALKALGEGLRLDTRSIEVELLPAVAGLWQTFRAGGAKGWWCAIGRHIVTVVGSSEPRLLS
jgi:4'-phosphopantetheinyl transferase